MVTKPLDMPLPEAGEFKREVLSGADAEMPPVAASTESTHIVPLKTKGFIFIGVLVFYAAFLTLYVLSQKEALFNKFLEMEKAYEAEWELRQADQSVFNSLMAIYTDIESLGKKDAGSNHLRDYLTMVKGRFEELEQYFPDSTPALTALSVGLNAAIKDPSKHNLISLRKTLANVRTEMAQYVVQRQDKLNALVENYRDSSENITTKVLGMGLFGIAGMVMVVGLFFTRLTDDLHALENRAGEIVTGAMTVPEGYPVLRRADEVGQLGQAIERMASEIEERERQLDIERKKIFHQDKMAAIGTLAAGIAHEVGNPIAAISALVNETRKEQMRDDVVCVNERCRGNLDFILHHTERLANITREISEFSTPQPSKRQLLDINSLVRSAASLMKYDKRFSEVDLQLNLDSQLPAIVGIGDQLLQVIMNLLINASDAVVHIEDGAPTITCSTFTTNGSICISVTDNGCGMNTETLDHAFEAFYTTKPAGKGTGLGLSLCHSIVTSHGGSIEIDSRPDEGCTIRVQLPVNGIEDGKEV